MNLVRRTLVPSLIAAVALALSGGARGENIKVGTAANPTIQSAVNAALANTDAVDTVLIPAGTYDESVFITITGANAQEELTLKKQTPTGQVLIRGLAGDSAIEITGARGIVLSDLIVQSGTLAAGGAADGIAAIEMSGEVQNVQVLHCAGVSGDDVGIAIHGGQASGVLVQKTNFIGVTQAGAIVEGRNHRFEQVNVTGTAAVAFRLEPVSDNCSLFKCKATGSGTNDPSNPGLFTIRGSGHDLAQCSAKDAGTDGFFLEAAGSRLEKCKSDESGQAGYRLAANDLLLDNCSATLNVIGAAGGGAGTRVESGSYNSNFSHGVMATADKMEIKDVAANSNGGHGILVGPGVQFVQVRDNKPKSNGGDGVRIEGSRCWVEGNSASGGDGLINAGTDNVGRDNKAKNFAQNDF